MKLREEIEPKIIQIEKICPQISRLLRGYDSEKDNKCLNIIKKISELTHKVITKDILSEYMEDDSICMVALRLSIGTPPLLHIPLSCDELLEIIQRIHSKNYVEYKVKAFPEDELWWVLSHDYYVPLLEKNMELSVVNGDLNLVSSYIASDAFTSTGNNKLQEIDGLSNLSIVKGTLTISKFQVLKKLPDWSKLEQLGGLTLLRLLECSDRILDLSKVNFVPFEDNEPLISITDGTIFSKIITKEDMSQVSMFLAPSGITGSSVGIDPELNFKSIKNFKYSSNMTTDPVFQFERVYGNMEIIRGSKKGVSAPNLVSVDGYLSIETTMANNISFPKLEIVGGQLCIIGNLNAVSNYDYDFTNLKSVGCSSNPQYIKEGVINNILYGSLDFMASNKDFTFPSLEHVGGVGMTVRAVKTISCPKLQAIDGTLCAANAASLTTFNMPTLTKLSGVRFIRLTRFVDYTFFKSFVEEEQIKKEDWLVTNCGYNPTYEDMQAGRYTQQ